MLGAVTASSQASSQFCWWSCGRYLCHLMSLQPVVYVALSLLQLSVSGPACRPCRMCCWTTTITSSSSVRRTQLPPVGPCRCTMWSLGPLAASCPGPYTACWSYCRWGGLDCRCWIFANHIILRHTTFCNLQAPLLIGRLVQ